MTDLIRDLHKKLPVHDRFHTILSPDTSLALPYVLAGYPVRMEYTFRIPATATLDGLMADMKGASRRNIVTTFNKLDVHLHHDLDLFLTLAREMDRQRQRTDGQRYQFAEIQSVFEAAHSREQAVIITAFDDQRTNLGTTVLLFDDQVAYLWVTARKLVLGNRAYSRLIWEAFKFANDSGRQLDLDGYPSIAGAQFLANFGAEAVIRPTIVKTNLRFDGVNLLRGCLRAGKATFGHAVHSTITGRRPPSWQGGGGATSP
jgi:hypothetical protein